MSRDPMWRRYRNFLRPRPAADADDEVRFHLEMREQEARRAGLPPDVARAAARERFGDVEGVVSQLRTIDGARERRRVRGAWLEELRHDLVFGARSLHRAPAFAVTAVATIAVAIAANTTIFSFVNALLLAPLPYARPASLVTIGGSIVGSIGEDLALRDRATSFQDIALYHARTITLGDDREAVRLDGVSVTPNMLTLLGAAPLVGGVFAPDASTPGSDAVILLSHALWTNRYGGDPTVVGRRVLVDGVTYTIAGVMPAAFRFPTSAAQFWTPLTIDRGNVAATWALGGTQMVGRLKPGVTPGRAAADARTVALGMRHLNPMWDPGDDYGKTMTVSGLQQTLTGGARPALVLLSACVAVLLLVACVNVANLLLARATARGRELAVRAALGGGRARLVRQLLTESVLLALVGGVVGVLLAAAGVRWVAAAMPADIPRAAEISISAPVLAFTTLLTLATGVAFGLLPALRATGAGFRAETVRGGRAGQGVAHHRLSAALVVGEVALAVLLVITAGLLVRSFAALENLTPGFRTTHIVTARVSPPPATYADRARADALIGGILSRMAALPGVSSVGATNQLPIASPVYGAALRIEGQFEDAQHGLPMVDHFQSVTPGYLSTLGIPVLRGRGFSDADNAGAQLVAIVSASVAKRFWPDGDALGKHIGYAFPTPWLTIVGVVPDVRLDSLRDTTSLAAYVPYAQRPAALRTNPKPDMTIVAGVAGDPGNVARAIRGVVAGLDRSVPVSDIRTMDDVLSRSVAKPRFTMLLVASFAAAALLLGAVGVYGVMSYLVSQRAREMGIRVALGATSANVLGLVLGRGAWLAGAGAAVGVAAALGVTRSLRSLLFGVSSTDAVTFVTVPLVFVIVALLASYGPARRATRADPVAALRAD